MMTRDEAIKMLQCGLAGVKAWNRKRQAGEEIPSLKGADLHGTYLGSFFQGVSFIPGANLSNVDLTRANLASAILTSANLRNTNLSMADLSFADLGDADLRDAALTDANLTGTRLCPFFVNQNTDVTRAKFSSTFVNCDASIVKGINTVTHFGPSSVDISAIVQFQGELPEKFLRGCGIREEEIAYFRGVVGKPIRFYSCFISYSTADGKLATRLHNDFQAAGIRCWKWDHDARTGRSLWGEIDRAIRKYDKLVLIASESSLTSPAVNREIERAIFQEDERLKKKQSGEFDGSTDVLFPVRVDDFIFDGWEHERKVDVTKKVIADAIGWDQDNDKYQAVLARLIRDLKDEPDAN